MKSWQDKVIMLVGLSFGFMLIPMVLDSQNGQTVSILTSLPTTIDIFILAYCFYTLHLKLAFVSNIFSGSMWALLFILGVMK